MEKPKRGQFRGFEQVKIKKSDPGQVKTPKPLSGF